MSKTCNGCGEMHTPVDVPYIVHESMVARQERQIKRLWIALIVAISVALITPLVVHFGWLWYESQFETYEYLYEQDGEGTNIIGNENEVNNGAEIENQDQEEKEE